MNEFELNLEELEKLASSQVLKQYICRSCSSQWTSWKDCHTCEVCGSAEITEIKRASTMPVTTGVMVEYSYDNIDSIDEDTDKATEETRHENNMKKYEEGRKL